MVWNKDKERCNELDHADVVSYNWHDLANQRLSSDNDDNNGNEEQTHDNASRLRNMAILFVVAMWALVDRVAPGQKVLILT